MHIFVRQQRLTNEDRPALSAMELLPAIRTFQQCVDYVILLGIPK